MKHERALESINLPTGPAKIFSKPSGGSSIAVDGPERFTATVRQLEVLAKLAEGKTAVESAQELGLHVATVKSYIATVVDRNTDQFSEDDPPSVEDLIAKARHHELLGEIPVAGIQSIVARMDTKEPKVNN